MANEENKQILDINKQLELIENVAIFAVQLKTTVKDVEELKELKNNFANLDKKIDKLSTKIDNLGYLDKATYYQRHEELQTRVTNIDNILKNNNLVSKTEDKIRQNSFGVKLKTKIEERAVTLLAILIFSFMIVILSFIGKMSELDELLKLVR